MCRELTKLMFSPSRAALLAFFILGLLTGTACELQSSDPALDILQATETKLEATTPAPPLLEQVVPATITPIPTLVNENNSVTMEPVGNDDRGQQMIAYLNQELDRGNFMGTVLVADDGHILVNEGFGLADVQTGMPNHPQTQFRLGSITKQFTAAAILKLQEQGLLDVQDPVAKYLPDYPRGNEITIHHLLTHTAGIPNYERRPDLAEAVQTPIALDDLIASFANQPLQFQPGQRFQYSSSGYVVLTKIIELVSGQNYADYLNRQFFTPLQMSGTGYDFLSPQLSNPATGYQITPGGPRPAIVTDSSWPSGAGALYSTVEDLYRWDRALYGGAVLSDESRKAFFAPYVDTGEGSHYGYGWEIGRTAGRSSVAHGGGIFGFAPFMARFPADDAVIIVLSNGIQMSPRVIAENLAQILFES